MKKILLSFFILSVFAITVSAQDKAKEKKGVKQEGAHQAEYNSNTEERDHAADIDSRNATKAKGDERINDAGEQEANEESADAENETNTEGVSTKDASSSGSPAVPSEDEELDGTNTVQRAKLNTAGSPIPGGGRNASVKPADNRNAAVARASQTSTKAKAQSKAEKSTDTKNKKK